MLWSTVEQTRADRKLKTIINAERAALSLYARPAGVSPLVRLPYPPAAPGAA